MGETDLPAGGPSGADDEGAVVRAAREEESKSSEAAAATGITAALVVMILFIRLLAVSGWQWATAADIADSFDFDDAVPIMFGTLFEMPRVSGIAAALILPLAIYRLHLMKVYNKKRWQLSDWLVIVLLVVVLFVLVRTYQMWWTAVMAVGLTVALGFFARYVQSGTLHDVVVAIARRTGTILIAGVFVLSVVVTTPWNVKEVITTQSDGEIVGHVLETTPGFVKVLTEDRDVIILLTGDIVSRKTIEVEE